MVANVSLTTVLSSEMGCASSVAPLSSIESPKNKNSTDHRHLVEAATQTDQIQTKDSGVDVITDESRSKDDELPKKSPKQESISPTTEANHEQHSIPISRLNVEPDGQQIEWVLGGFEAMHFSSSLSQEFYSIGPTAIQQAIQAMRAANELQQIPSSIWNLLDQANQTNDPTFFIRAYTAISDFYRILNRTLAQHSTQNFREMDLEEQMQTMLGNVMQQFSQAITVAQNTQAGRPTPVLNPNEMNWAKLFLRPIYKFLMVPNSSVRYEGKTYRGMRLPIADIMFYENNGPFFCNKAVTSTSKLESVARGFLSDDSSTSTEQYPVLFIYNIDGFASLYALSIRDYSVLPREEEVLLLPGILFSIVKVDRTSEDFVQIELRSAWKDISSMMSSSVSSLFSVLRDSDTSSLEMD